MINRSKGQGDEQYCNDTKSSAYLWNRFRGNKSTGKLIILLTLPSGEIVPITVQSPIC